MMRWLNETMWFPAVWTTEVISWESVDDRVAIGSVTVGDAVVLYQDLTVVAVAALALAALGIWLQRSDTGRAIRAVEQARDAARLQGIPVVSIYLRVFALAGALAALSGVMISATTQLSPGFGNEPMLKAFIVCVLAGMGSMSGVAVTAIALGLVEAWVQYRFGAHWGFPALLVAVMVALVWRPGGLFTAADVRRL